MDALYLLQPDREFLGGGGDGRHLERINYGMRIIRLFVADFQEHFVSQENREMGWVRKASGLSVLWRDAASRALSRDACLNGP
ncbi:hypothetical protein Sj15T_14100 [Sphingobium sp. TA15]|nr:hypothetical protein Sj15T_14100 [Sphingobium sp. TA15]